MLLRSSLLLVISFLAAPTAAQDTEEPPYRLAESRTVYHEGSRYECFDLEGYVGLLRLDTDHFHLSEQHLILEAQFEHQRLVVDALLRTEMYYTNQLTILNDERSRLQEMWQEENRLRLEAENTPSLSTKIGWGLAITFGVISVGLSVALIAGG